MVCATCSLFHAATLTFRPCHHILHLQPAPALPPLIADAAAHLHCTLPPHYRAILTALLPVHADRNACRACGIIGPSMLCRTPTLGDSISFLRTRRLAWNGGTRAHLPFLRLFIPCCGDAAL